MFLTRFSLSAPPPSLSAQQKSVSVLFILLAAWNVNKDSTDDVSGSLIVSLINKWKVLGQNFPSNNPSFRVFFRLRCLLSCTLAFCYCVKYTVTVHEKTKYKSKIASLDDAHLKVRTLCYFMLKSDLPKRDKITSVWDNAVLFSACYFSLLILLSSLKPNFRLKKKKKERE